MKSGAMLHQLLIEVRDSESGQGLVEAAFALAFLALVLIGVVGFGQIIYISVEVQHAAKAGVQYGSLNGITAPDTTGIQRATAAAAPSLTLVTTSSTGCVCSNGNASTCALTDCSTSHIEQTVTVNTQTTFKPILRLPGFPATYTIKGKAIQECLQ
jgi:Flp pilus assembly protein TadG